MSSPQRSAEASTQSCENTSWSGLLDRHLAEQGRMDLLERRHPYTREIRDLTPEDLPALIEADRLRNEEEHHRGRTESFREAQANLGQPIVAELAKAAKASHR